MKKFENLILIAADDVAELRRCDVYRVIEQSHYVNGIDPEQFAKWLAGKRPDLENEVAECLADCRAT